MNTPVRDTGPLAWVMDELTQTLRDVVEVVAQFVHDNQVSRQTDLVAVDATALRMARQQLHQAVGALELVDLPAAATTLRALESALQRCIHRPALATDDALAVVCAGTYALLEYLDRLMHGRSVSELALFPTYRDWQGLAGTARAHPADLWTQPHVVVEAPPGKVYEPGPPVRAHLDRLVLQVVKGLNPQAALSLAQLCGGLARAAAPVPVQQFWLAAAAYFEAVASGRLPDQVYVKRAASSVLLQYAQLVHGDLHSLEAHTHDLLCLASRVPPDPADPAQLHLQRVWAGYGWHDATPWDPESRRLGSVDPTATRALQRAVQAAQQSWSVWLVDTPTALSGPLEAAVQGLHAALHALSTAVPPLAQLAALWQTAHTRLAMPEPWPRPLALEVSHHLLLLGAELADFDPWDPDMATRLHALGHRLQQALDGQAVPEPEPWMAARYQQVDAASTLVQVVAQWRDELAQLEQALDAALRQRTAQPLQAIDRLDSRMDALLGLATLLDVPAARAALGVIRDAVNDLRRADTPWTDAVTDAASERLGPNVAALGLLLDALARQPELARTAFVFDEAAGVLLAPVSRQSPVPPDLPAVPSTPITPAEWTPPTHPEDDSADELLAIFIDEAMAVLDNGHATLDVLRQKPASGPDLAALRRGFHTLKGSARMVRLTDVGDAAWAMEQLLNTWLAEQTPATEPLLQLCGDAFDALRRWVTRLQAGEPEAVAVAVAGQSALVRASADALRLEGRVIPLVLQATPAPSTPPERPEPPVLQDVVELPHDMPPVPVLDEPVKVVGSLHIDLDLFHVFLNEADDWSRQLAQALTEWAMILGEAPPPACARWAHALVGGAAAVGYTGLSQLARQLEHALDRVAALPPNQSVPPEQARVCVTAADQIRQMLHQFAAGFVREPDAATLAALDAVCANAPTPTLPPADDHLTEVFADEAVELMRRLSSVLRQWVARPDNLSARAEVLRNLHTLKGSARLAGCLPLGDRVHGLEDQILRQPLQPTSSELQPLLDALDGIATDISQLTLSVPGAVEPAVPPGWLPAPVPMPHDSTAAGAATVRVKADLLDQLMAHTGDVMIARARLDNDMRALRQSFQDMSSNIERLRSQLRDLELQTETQLQSRQALSRESDARFDPLEFDRYTRVQELTRLLAESVNDVATVQYHLQRSVESADGNLAAQARQTRDLQRDLLRTRLVTVDILDERLHRVVRQTAESSGKQVTLQLTSTDVTVDRAVLERLTPVLEHLLRNAVVHGIEPTAQRVAAGKLPDGQIEVAWVLQGHDLSVTVSDDGRGLDIDALRRRAVALGLHADGAAFTHDDAVRAIFAPGLSTADGITEWAGRGIGLDVVRTDVLGLGGRIEFMPSPTGGAAFRLVVPQTTAVTQVVMLRVGDGVLGVPAPWVERIRRVPASALTAAYLSGQWQGADDAMPFFWAGALLAWSPEPTDTPAHATRDWPVVECYTAGQRVAWQVDEVLGHQEVVLKPTGPLLARLPGLAGATVQASGAVALIYNPVALSALLGEQARAWARQQRSQTPARAASLSPDEADLAPLVLVVDDSITVRRVTQRLLRREGYRVALAADGLQALDRIRTEPPVVVLSDIEMPHMDGFELVQALRSDPATADLPVVMITSRLADKHRDHARSLGVDHYLGKPYAEDDLLGLVRGYARLSARRGAVG